MHGPCPEHGEHDAPTARLFVIGAGHVAQAIAPVAQLAGFELAVFDDREEFLERPAFAGIHTGAYDVDELDAAMPELTDADYILIITRDHARDERALASLIRRPHRYLGMIGSRRKVHTVLARVVRRELGLGRPRPDFSRVRAPIGLDLGGRSPAEIAVSIIAELVADRRGGDGAPMNLVPELSRRGASDRSAP